MLLNNNPKTNYDGNIIIISVVVIGIKWKVLLRVEGTTGFKYIQLFLTSLKKRV